MLKRLDWICIGAHHSWGCNAYYDTSSDSKNGGVAVILCERPTIAFSLPSNFYAISQKTMSMDSCSIYKFLVQQSMVSCSFVSYLVTVQCLKSKLDVLQLWPTDTTSKICNCRSWFSATSSLSFFFIGKIL
jgi:hypothetical protein